MTANTNEAAVTESITSPDAEEQEEETEEEEAKTDGEETEQGDETQQSAKTKSFADDLICPISHELPWEPVTAMDGRVYEHKSIQHRNIIETAIEKGEIPEDLPKEWNKRVQQKNKMEKMVKKAEDGDAQAMYDVAINYVRGTAAVEQDLKLSFQWVEKAHCAGSVIATAVMGHYYLAGLGVRKCLIRGIMFLTMAAGHGSDWAAHVLGMVLARGNYGVVVDKSVALFWLKKALGKCAHKNMSDSQKKECEELLNELKANDSSSSTP
ncbi:repeat-containing protein [Seminavis robusta]|uniref:Repeat-containing protein n=1 Tax=Seminavis robusta TaxID=568900 RepID=A0A9N8HRE7_9STRA|nr:repeat-containing protein [Seminavis robusta]|eukprot:Sro1311_g261790.1 repeat-containing protein (267) ;mRNA; f:28599-29467